MIRMIRVVAFAMLTLGLVSVASAGVLVTNVTVAGNSFDFAQNSGIGTGFLFATSFSTAEVTKLGLYHPLPGTYATTTVTDNTLSTQIVLAHVDVGGSTATVVAQATLDVNTGTNSLDANRFQYVSLASPVTLIQGDSYILLNNDPSPNWEINNSGGVNQTLAAGFTQLGAAASYTGPTGAWAAGTITANDSISVLNFGGTTNTYGAPTFQFEVPEPASIGLLTLGGVGLLRRNRARLVK